VSVLVLGVSHHSSPIALLDEVAVAGTETDAMLADLLADPRVAEAMVLATCNRLEVYASAPRFHPAVDAIRTALARHSGVDPERLRPHLFVHHGEAAAEHLFLTCSGLDSMVTGESQIRYQVRTALQAARERGSVGPALSELVESGLRVGKRVQSETRIDEAGRSLADEGFAALAERGVDVEGATVVVLGAGSMASVAAAAARRRQAEEIVVINRDPERGTRLAASVGGVAASWDALSSFLGKADVVVACTGAAGTLVGTDAVASAREGATSALGVLDLAMPHDVEPDVRRLPGVALVGMIDLANRLDTVATTSASLQQARAIVGEEVSDYVADQSAAAAVPTVVALRRHADEVVAAEVERLERRLGGSLDPGARDEVTSTIRRIVSKLLHTPTVRVKQAAAVDATTDYDAALRHLFALDPGQVSAVSRRDSRHGGGA
jgi:glutamyl-tRNA reductase